MTGKRTEAGWAFLALIALLASWLASTGRVWLRGLPLEQVERLAYQRGLIGGQEPPGGVHLGLLDGDPFWWSTLITTGFTVASLLLGLVVFRKLWKNPISPMLTMGLLLFGGSTCWLTGQSSLGAGVHFLEVAALAALLLGKVAVMSALVPALCALEPGSGIALYPALTYLALRRYEAYGPVVTGSAVIGVGLLLIPMVGNFQLVPGLEGLSLWSLLPLLLLAWPAEIRKERPGFYLTLLLGAVLSGRPELASAVALGDLALILLKRTAPAEPAEACEQEWQLSQRAVFHGLAVLAFLLAILPGERYLNRQVLIPAQKKKVPFLQLFSVFDLSYHAARLEEDPWRRVGPYPQLRSADVSALKQLPKEGGFTVLTVGESGEDRMLSLLCAHLSGRPLMGWDNKQHLSGPMLLCKRRGKNFLVGGPALMLRGQEATEISLGASRDTLPAEPTAVDFRRLINVPYRLQVVSREPNGGYVWVANKQNYTLLFADQPAEVSFGVTPGMVKLLALGDEKNKRELEIHPTKWALRFPLQQKVLPSRSLINVEVVLQNLGAGTVSADGLKAIRLGTAESSFCAFQQPLEEDFILFPGESLPLNLTLATPEPEGTYDVVALALTPQGTELPLPLVGGQSVKTWRRLPPVGTWVEEP